MANESDFNLGTRINGRTRYRNTYMRNGMIEMDPGIAPVTIPAQINFSGDKTKILVSGTMGYLSTPAGSMLKQFNPINPANKGTDALYILAAKAVGEYSCYDNSTNVSYNYWKDKEMPVVTALTEGLRIWLQAAADIEVGTELTSTDEYKVAPASSGSTGTQKLFIAESSVKAGEIVLCRVRLNGLV